MNFGPSEASARTIRRAHAVQPVAAVETEYSFMQRDPEHNGVLQSCEELGIGFVPCVPGGQGFLTAKIDRSATFDPKADMRWGFPRFAAEAMSANQPVIDLLKELAATKKATPAQIALAWVMAQKPWIVPIPGTRSLEHLRENVGAVDVALTADDLQDVSPALAAINIKGGRMNEEQMEQVDKS